MKTYTTILIVSLLLLSTSAFPQKQGDQLEKPYIEVTGTAEKEVIPDEIFIAISLLERQDGKEKKSIEQQEEQLKKGLQEIGIDLKNLSLSDASSDYVRIKVSKRDVISKTDYLLKVSSATQVGKVFEKLDELKIEEAKIAYVSHTKMEEFRKEVKIQAIKAAKEKADYLLAAIGEQAGKPLVILENSYPNQMQSNTVMLEELQESRERMDVMYSSKSEPMLQFKKIKIKSSFYVKFSIQ